MDESTLPWYTREEVSSHASASDMWVIIGERVYDFTRYIEKHPGGSKEIMQHAGGDATTGFRGPQHPEHVNATAKKFLVGRLRVAASGEGVATAGAGAGAAPSQ